MSLALYRKYRPSLFGEVLGQTRVAKTLSQALKNHRVGHAYIFSGPRGTGKTSVARILARAVNCENNTADGLPGGEPCNKCSACQRALHGQELDLIEIDAASNRGIDEIRELREKVKFAPGKNSKKVFLIDEFHMLTKEAFNALLKTLEEPPAHAIFILATTEIHNVPSTILSRAQHFIFKALGQKDLENLVTTVAQKENISISPEATRMLATQAQGGARDVLGLLDLVSAAAADQPIDQSVVIKNLALPDVENLSAWTNALVAGDQAQVVSLIKTLSDNGIDFINFGKNLVLYLRSIVLYQVDHELGSSNAVIYTPEQDQAIQEYAKQLDKKTLLLAMGLINQATSEIRLSPLDFLPIELATLKLFEQTKMPSPANKSAFKEKVLRAPAEKKTKNVDIDVGAVDHEPLSPVHSVRKSRAIIESDSLADLDPAVQEKIVSTWQQTVAHVRDKNIGLASLLNNVVLLQASKQQALLVVDYEFYKDRIMSRENRHLIEAKLEQILGHRVSISCCIASSLSGVQKEQYQQKKKNQTPGKLTENTKTVKKEEPLAQLAVDLLGGQVLD